MIVHTLKTGSCTRDFYCSGPVAMFEKDPHGAALVWQAEYTPLLIAGPRFKVPLYQHSDDEQDKFEKTYTESGAVPELEKVLVTQGHLRGLVGYFVVAPKELDLIALQRTALRPVSVPKEAV